MTAHHTRTPVGTGAALAVILGAGSPGVRGDQSPVTSPGAHRVLTNQEDRHRLMASPAYQLLGRKGMSAKDLRPIETGVMDGDVAFRQHAAGHTPGPNWPVFLDFAGRYRK